MARLFDEMVQGSKLDRYVISWADQTSANLGVRVLAEGNKTLFTESGANVEFENFGSGNAALLSTRDVLTSRVMYPRLAKVWKKSFDTLIDTCGGDSFTDIYGLDRLKRIALVHRAAHAAGMRVVMGPQTIGPFETAVGRRIAVRVLSEAHLVFARDSASFEFAESIAPQARLTPSTDVVFALPSVSSPVKTWDVLINVSGLLFGVNNHVDNVAYQSEIRRLIDASLARGYRIGLLAHVLDNPSPDNDVPAVRELAAHYGRQVEAVIPTTLTEARASIAASRSVVGSRMHACLNSLSLGVPAFPWAYSRKFLPLMRDLGWKHGVDIRREKDTLATTLEFLGQADSLSAEVGAVRDLATRKLTQAASAFTL